MYFLPGTFCLLVPPCVQIHSNYPGLSFLLSSPPHLTAITVVNIMMCVCVCVCVLGILAVLVCPQDHGSPVVWVTWRFGPSQLPQMVRAQQQSARGERGGSAVITSWLSGSAVRRVQQQERVGVAWRLNGGPWSLRGQVLGVCACVCVYMRGVSIGAAHASTSAGCVGGCVWPLMLVDAAAHTWRTWSPEHLLRPSSCLFVQPSERTRRNLFLLLCCFSPWLPGS